MVEIRWFLIDVITSVFGNSEFVYDLASPAHESILGMVVAVLIAIWVYAKGRSLLISLGISLLLCPIVAFIAQLFLSERKDKSEERLNRGMAYAIMRFFFS